MVDVDTKTRLLEMLKEYFYKEGVDVRIEVVEEKPQYDTTITRHDVIRKKDGEDWFCFSIVLNSEGGVAIWTRGHIKIHEGPYAVPIKYQFLEGTFNEWLEGEVYRNHNFKQLTDA